MVRRVEVALRLGRAAEAAVTPAHLDVTLELDDLGGGAIAHRGVPADPRLAASLRVRSTLPSTKCSRQSHGVAMRRRRDRVADEPSTK